MALNRPPAAMQNAGHDTFKEIGKKRQSMIAEMGHLMNGGSRAVATMRAGAEIVALTNKMTAEMDALKMELAPEEQLKVAKTAHLVTIATKFRDTAMAHGGFQIKVGGFRST